MKKIKNALGFVWKHNRVWLIISISALLVVFALTMVATQNTFLSNTISTVLGGDRRVAVSGDPSKYQYYTANADDFKQFEATTALKSKKDVLKDANIFNESIAEEGTVLLKNESNSLPLKASANVSVFGKNSVNLVCGGSGSSVKDSAGMPTIFDSLEAANFTVNPVLRDFYNSGASGKGRGDNPAIGTIVSGLAVGETPQSLYTDSVRNSYAEYNDAAIIVISRIGGEGFDLPRTMKKSFADNASAISGASANDHYLELDKNERALIAAVTTSGTFDKVIVVINCSTSMELGTLQDNPAIDAMLWIGSPGGTGINALGKILSGEVNPSGRLVDTYARDFTKDPSWANFGTNLTADGDQYTVGSAGQYAYFVEYEEGIYVGYRYYETRGYTDGEDWYNENVVYPFGYGLSYNEFEWDVKFLTENVQLDADSEIKVEVTVTNPNTSKYAGRDVVQLYYNPVYWEGEIEKAHVVLGDFAKTKTIQPGQSDKVTLTLRVSDMASYDFASQNPNGNTGYELDAGEYGIFVGRNAHEAWTAEDAEREKYYYLSDDIIYDKDIVTGYEVVNRFDDVSSHIKTYLSRENWDLTMPKAPTVEEREVDKEFIDALEWTIDDSGKVWEQNQSPTQGDKANAVMLHELIVHGEDGITVDYQSDLWTNILNALTVSEIANLIGTGNFNTAAIAVIGKPRTIDPDGPAGFTNFMAAGNAIVYDTCFYASECVIAATFNKLIAYDMGIMIGIESIVGNERGDGTTYSGWYAPAVNIHRSQFGGRNWEYYSEDGFLSGKMAANVVMAAKSKGVYTYIKHFALNDQETNRDRNGLITWASEQAMREIYLKPFEYTVKEGGTTAMMSSFNRIGTVWAGGSYELLTEVLRNEWGFKGMVITDYNLSEYMYADQMIRAGGDLNLTQSKLPTTSSASSTQLHCMRNATKNILYTVAQSNAMNGSGDGVVWGYAIPTWQLLLIIANISLLAIFGIWGFFAIRYKLKKSKSANTKTE